MYFLGMYDSAAAIYPSDLYCHVSPMLAACEETHVGLLLCKGLNNPLAAFYRQQTLAT